MYELSRSYKIEAAHDLPHAPVGHKCRRLHGHSFVITVRVGGAICEPEGWVIDFGDIDAAVEPLMGELDHRYLNDVTGLSNPTSENLAAWIWARLEGELPSLKGIEVGETCRSRVLFNGPDEEDRG
jgi:6-pyruvoyltetrahydropterin/6-carboxytetrahydropterin synthase